MNTDLPIVFAGLRVSPARMATYSNPLSAPSAILPRKLRLSMVSGGIDIVNGWYSVIVPRCSAINGTSTSAPYVMSCPTPPKACIHLPTRRPNIASAVIITISPTLTTGVYHAAPVSQAPLAPTR